MAGYAAGLRWVFCVAVALGAGPKELGKPRGVFNDHNAFWTSRDSAGGLVFTFDRVAGKVGLPEEGSGAAYVYGRFTDGEPNVLLRDGERGVVYQARWESKMNEGTGRWVGTRDLYFLCDGQNRWYFLAEGPGFDTGRGGAAESVTGRVEARAEWGAEKGEPVKLVLTRVVKNFVDSDKTDATVPRALEIRMDVVPVWPGRELKAEEAFVSEEGIRLRRVGEDYVLIQRPEPFSAVVSRVAYWKAGVRGDDAVRDGDKTAKVESLLMAANPKAPARLPAGFKLVVPKNVGQ